MKCFTNQLFISCLSWPVQHPNEIFFGLAEGKMRVGYLKNNKSNSLFVLRQCVLAGGNDCRVSFYEEDGNRFQQLDYSKEAKGYIELVVSRDLKETSRNYVYNYNQKRPNWDEISGKHSLEFSFEQTRFEERLQ